MVAVGVAVLVVVVVVVCEALAFGGWVAFALVGVAVLACGVLVEWVAFVGFVVVVVVVVRAAVER